MNKDVYVVKRLRLLQFLVNEGFKEYTVIPDPTSNKGFSWFLFNRSPELEAALEEYFAHHLRDSK
jgi:hypothetical protein